MQKPAWNPVLSLNTQVFGADADEYSEMLLSVAATPRLPCKYVYAYSNAGAQEVSKRRPLQDIPSGPHHCHVMCAFNKMKGDDTIKKRLVVNQYRPSTLTSLYTVWLMMDQQQLQVCKLTPCMAARDPLQAEATARHSQDVFLCQSHVKVPSGGCQAASKRRDSSCCCYCCCC